MSALEYVRTRSVLNSRTSCSRCSGLARRQLAPIAIRVVCAKSKWGRIFVSTRLASFFGMPAWMSLSWRIAATGNRRMAAGPSPPLRRVRNKVLMTYLRLSFGSRELAYHFFRLRLGGRHRVLEGLFAHRHAFDAHHMHVRDADESEDGAKVGLLEVELPGGPFRIDAAARDHDDGPLALQQAFGAFLAVGKGAPGAHDVVDPRLQAGRQTEVVHGDGEHDDVGRDELVHQRVR